jgi:hypothetical protein
MTVYRQGKLPDGRKWLIGYRPELDDELVDEIQSLTLCGQLSRRESGFLLYQLHECRVMWRANNASPKL